ncbi:MAG: type III polyketide synthase [Alphaproteobacteria bacterium]|nr:type III polyketide synthase [Alphaproteobacteria bacterium]
MAEPRIQSIGRAVPERRVAQQDLLVHSPWRRSPLLERLFLDSPVHTRGFFVPPEFYATPRTLTETNAAWREGALLLGGRAVRDSLSRAGLGPRDVDLFAVTTVTGYTTPGLDLLLARQESMRSDFARAHFNCVGCHAAIPLLKVAADHVSRRPGDTALALAVEVCSACFSERDAPENLVATALFADGAACATIGTGGDGPVLLDFGSRYDFEHIDTLGFDLDALGFRIVLDPSIPDLVASHIEPTVDDLLARNGVERSAVRSWALHPGGSRILEAVGTALGLDDRAMAASRRVLRTHGNMSSPSVLFSLAEDLRTHGVPSDGYGVMAAFGPGLGIEVALLGFGR